MDSLPQMQPGGTPRAPAPPVWEVALRRQLRHGSSRFDLDVRFASTASRVALFGPSGAGKTQTLRMICGITPPDSGRVALAGRVLFDREAGVSLSPQQRRLAYVFQDYALFPHLSVKQNIAFACRHGWRNPPLRMQEPRADVWIERFGLQAVCNHYPHQISGGQRQRTALARALVTEPAALLLDEPFAALDGALRRQLRTELLQLQQSLQLPLLLITHDDDDLAQLAEQVVCLAGGRVAACNDARLGLDACAA